MVELQFLFLQIRFCLPDPLGQNRLFYLSNDIPLLDGIANPYFQVDQLPICIGDDVVHFSSQQNSCGLDIKMQATSFNDEFVDIFISSEEHLAGSESTGYDYKLVDGASFEYTFDGIFSTGDPSEREFCWSPAHGQEGEYKMSFKAKDKLGELATTFAGAVDERCYTIFVTEAVAEFSEDASISVPGLAEHLHDTCGFSVGMWIYPQMAESEMSVMTAGYSFDVNTILGQETVNDVMHQLKLTKYLRFRHSLRIAPTLNQKLRCSILRLK